MGLLGGRETGCSCAQRGSHPSLETQGKAAEWGERMEKSPISRLPSRPSAVQHLNGITALLISCFEP